MGRFSLPALELNKHDVTVTSIARALGCSVQYVSLQLNGQRPLDPAMRPVVRALTNSDEIADQVFALIPGVAE